LWRLHATEVSGFDQLLRIRRLAGQGDVRVKGTVY
jgi:hypothetical protein